MTAQKIKYLGIILTINAQNLYEVKKNLNPERLKVHLNKCKDIHCLWIGQFNIIKISVFPKAIYKFSAIPIKNQWALLWS